MSEDREFILPTSLDQDMPGGEQALNAYILNDWIEKTPTPEGKWVSKEHQRCTRRTECDLGVGWGKSSRDNTMKKRLHLRKTRQFPTKSHDASKGKTQWNENARTGHREKHMGWEEKWRMGCTKSCPWRRGLRDDKDLPKAWTQITLTDCILNSDATVLS